MRPGKLVTPRSHWPPFLGGYQMLPVPTDSVIPEFHYSPSHEYQARF